MKGSNKGFAGLEMRARGMDVRGLVEGSGRSADESDCYGHKPNDDTLPERVPFRAARIFLLGLK